MTEIARLRTSIQTRGRYIDKDLESAKKLLQTKEQIPPDEYMVACELAVALKTFISDRTAKYKEILEEFFTQVNAQCIGDELDRYNLQYEQCQGLVDVAELTVTELKVFVDVLKLRLDMTAAIESLSRQVEEVELPRSVNTGPTEPMVHSGTQTDIEHVENYNRWLMPLESVHISVHNSVTNSIQSERTHFAQPSTPLIPQQTVSWIQPLFSSTPIGAPDPSRIFQGVPSVFNSGTTFANPTPYTAVTTSVVYTTATTTPRVSCGVSEWLAPISGGHRSDVAPGMPNAQAESWLLPETKTDVTKKEKSVESEQNNQVTDDARLLTRIPIPHFKGDKREYEGWKAAFSACVHNTKMSAEHKMLRLHETLQGEPKKILSNLGYSKTAYNTAMTRLDKKYGGNRRRVRIRLEDVESFKQIRDNNEKDLQSLAELLDVLIVNLTEAGDEQELHSTTLYLKVQKKLTKTLICKYEQWIDESKELEGLESLREFIDRQAEYLTKAGEVVRGISDDGAQKAPQKAFVTQSVQSEPKKCAHCGESHAIWFCNNFKSLSVEDRWNKVKELGLCFRCLSAGHLGRDCKNVSLCNIDDCKANHNRLLHGGKKGPNEGDTNSHKYEDIQNSQVAHVTTMTTGKGDEVFSLRTAPVKVSNGSASVTVHALLDDCSDTSYINKDVTNELDITGEPEDVTVGTLNGQKTHIGNSAEVSFTIESIDGKVSAPMSAYITNNVVGDLKVTDWNKVKRKYDHLKEIKFPKFDKNHKKIGLLIGANMTDLLYSLQDVRGGPGQPIARLTPLGWTCIGDLRS